MKSESKKYSVAVSYTISGFITIEANSIKDAKKECRKLNNEGINPMIIEDADCSSKVHTVRIEKYK